jgi:hypothetical protein
VNKRTFSYGGLLQPDGKGGFTVAETVADTVPALTPELALREAIICQALFANTRIRHNVSEAYKDNFKAIARTIFEPQQYLFWDSDILMQVIDHVEDFKGTIVPFTQKMSQIWSLDASLLSGENLVMGIYFRADSNCLFMAHIMQDIKAVLDIDQGYVEWYEPYYWGNPIDGIRQAYAAAVYTWLQQPYVCQTEAIQHSRQVRRHAEQKGQILKNISVIQFRKPDGTVSHANEGSSGRELHCCYERAGHTRRQPYGPKKALRRVIWIAPTLVGDTSKPFKTKGQTLYRVSR